MFCFLWTTPRYSIWTILPALSWGSDLVMPQVEKAMTMNFLKTISVAMAIILFGFAAQGAARGQTGRQHANLT